MSPGMKRPRDLERLHGARQAEIVLVSVLELTEPRERKREVVAELLHRRGWLEAARWMEHLRNRKSTCQVSCVAVVHLPGHEHGSGRPDGRGLEGILRGWGDFATPAGG